jgi:hypothetical protein
MKNVIKASALEQRFAVQAAYDLRQTCKSINEQLPFEARFAELFETNNCEVVLAHDARIQAVKDMIANDTHAEARFETMLNDLINDTSILN